MLSGESRPQQSCLGPLRRRPAAPAGVERDPDRRAAERPATHPRGRLARAAVGGQRSAVCTPVAVQELAARRAHDAPVGRAGRGVSCHGADREESWDRDVEDDAGGGRAGDVGDGGDAAVARLPRDDEGPGRVGGYAAVGSVAGDVVPPAGDSELEGRLRPRGRAGRGGKTEGVSSVTPVVRSPLASGAPTRLSNDGVRLSCDRCDEMR